MKWPLNLFGAPIVQQYERKHAIDLPRAKDIVLDNLEIAVCDANGKRFKERDVRAALKVVSGL